ncbi:hypothetical protein EBZ39_13660 [bacterium]|nr:hypothetical protein [bacterium]
MISNAFIALMLACCFAIGTTAPVLASNKIQKQTPVQCADSDADDMDDDAMDDEDEDDGDDE